MSKPKKEDSADEKLGGSKNLLNSLLNGYSDTHFNGIKKDSYNISSGSLILDEHVKLKSGQIVRMGGPAETGKTSQSLLFAKHYMDSVPKSKTIYINAEAKFGEEIQKRTGLNFTDNSDDWNYGTVFIFSTNVFDTICDTLNSLYRRMYDLGEHLCVILDSVDMLVLAQSLEKDMTQGKKPAGINFLTKELFRRLGHCINSYNGLLLMITQYSATFQLDAYSKAPPQMMEGNQTNALNHQVSWALYYRQRFAGDYILEKEKERPDPIKNKILGVWAKVEIKKSLIESTGFTIEIPIKKGAVGNQIWSSKEVADTILGFGWAKKAGAWITFDKIQIEGAKEIGIDLKEKVNGINELYDYLEQDTAVLKLFYDKIKTINS